MNAAVLPVTGRAGTDKHASTPATTVADVFAALGPAVHGYLRAAGAHDSEDVLSEVFLRVARRLGRFRGDNTDLRRWVFTIAHNCLMDEHRQRNRQHLLLRRLTSKQPAAPAPDEPLDPALHQGLLRLTPQQRQVITLRFVADLSLEEVAQITGRPTGAVKSLQHRALRALASQLTPNNPEAPIRRPDPPT